jgi:VacB/RNase II family 3'-5' exoribonuclease
MKTKDLIAKRLRREKATQRKNKNQQISKQSNNVIEKRETEYTLPTGFSDEVMKDIQRLPQDAISTEILRRRDMRETLTFTIDPDEAKDFDDALSFQILDSGNYQIGIHIADVTHYVQEQTALDDEAYQRGTSIYLVDRVIPMLPERLSNELCSLRPLEDKLCMSVVVEMDPTAKVIRHKICRTVIRSDYRLTYRQAQDILEDLATLSFSGSSEWILELWGTAHMIPRILICSTISERIWIYSSIFPSISRSIHEVWGTGHMILEILSIHEFRIGFALVQA